MSRLRRHTAAEAREMHLMINEGVAKAKEAAKRAGEDAARAEMRFMVSAFCRAEGRLITGPESKAHGVLEHCGLVVEMFWRDQLCGRLTREEPMAVDFDDYCRQVMAYGCRWRTEYLGESRGFDRTVTSQELDGMLAQMQVAA